MFTKFNKFFYILEKKDAFSFVILLVLMIIGIFAEMLSISLIIPIIGIIQNPEFISENKFLLNIKSLNKFQEINSFYVFILLSIILIFIMKNLFLLFQQFFQIRFVYGIQKKLSKKLFDTYIKMPYENYLNRNSSTLIRNTIIEVEHFTSTVMSACYVILDSLLIIGLTSIMIFRDPISSLYILICIGSVIFIFQILTKNKILILGKNRQISDEKRMFNLQQGLGGIKEIKVFGRENFFIKKYEEYNSRSADILSTITILRSIPRLLMETLAIISVLTLIIVMLFLDKNMDEFLISLGLFTAIAFKIFPSLSRLLSSLQVIRYSTPIIDVLYKEFNDISDKNISLDNSIIKVHNQKFELKDIKISNLCFSYPNKSKIINNLNIKIKAGSVIGIFGASGVGKSTFLDIFMGLIKPSEGTIYYGDFNIFENIKAWQKNIGYVPQNIYLIDDTLKNNIAYGINQLDIDDNKIYDSIKKSHLTNFIDSLPNKLNTIVGERGNRISGGQKQRIGISRALYNDPNILVLDEATSALDSSTEEQIVNTINQLRKNKTIIIISHRQSTLEKCDFIYQFKNEKLVLVQDLSK